MTRKMFIKETDATLENGTAGCEIICMSHRQMTQDGPVVEVYVDQGGDLAGPITVAQADIETRTIEDHFEPSVSRTHQHSKERV